jgi:Raf kinase inhibitor-like YbhB/YbcL family protein
MFTLMSSGIRDGIILSKYGILSEDCIKGVPQLSFPLEWSDPPEGTVSYAIVFKDYDNIADEGVCWLHWLISEIPSTVRGLAEGASRTDHSLVQGCNSWVCPFGSFGCGEEITHFYGGPAPVRSHEYEVWIYALDFRPGLSKGFYLNELRNKVHGHILGMAVLKGVYQINQ